MLLPAPRNKRNPTKKGNSEESRVRLGPSLGSYTVGPFGASLFGTCSFLQPGAGRSARGGQILGIFRGPLFRGPLIISLYVLVQLCLANILYK